MKEVDLTKCKAGDTLVSKHGWILTYVGPSGNNDFPHEVCYHDGSYGTRIDSGHVMRKNRLDGDHDIIAVITVEQAQANRDGKTQ